MDKIILHCDLNNFYASVECLKNPELHNKPVAVAGNPKNRTGIILAKNMIAKKHGVQTGEVIWKAKQKCPDLVCVAPHHDEYAIISKRVREIYLRYTNFVEPFGLDECWLDVTASTKLFGNGKEIADKIREDIKREIGLTISVGVSFCKMFAKLGSDLKKPDATTVISKENYKSIVYPLPVESLMFVGKSRLKQLHMLNIKTVKDLANADEKTLTHFFGIGGKQLLDIAQGKDDTTVSDYNNLRAIKSIGNGLTATQDIDTYEQATQLIYYLAENVSHRLREHHLAGLCVTLDIKDNLLKTTNHSKTINNPINNASEIAKECIALLNKNWDFGSRQTKIRALRISVSTLVDGDYSEQLTLFCDNKKSEKIKNQDIGIDKIRDKYGYATIRRGILFNNKNIIRQDVFDTYLD